MINIATNIRELNNISPAPFSEELIICESDYVKDKGIYLYPDSEKIQGDVPLDRIIGHSQIYDEMKWGDCLQGRYLKRIDRCLQELQENPEYYLSCSEKSGLSFIKIENDYFIVSGKHRTVVARFLAHFNADTFREHTPLRNVTIHQKRVDYDFMSFSRKVEELKVIYPNLNFVMTYTSKNDANCLSVHSNRYHLPSGYYTRGELAECIHYFKNPSIKRKLESDKTHRFISFKNCFRSLLD
ncbi:hypothetical protein [Vibrio anguillarum]|uniref:ParB/Sulfiredoxin domain-containing protein n=1 Tax=Vibrio anguillarum TaxID=55601 RepID=A0ABR9Z7S8_VIBAN|nr:hypothetical protein [Vibrio anguillarum]MBF4374453.1 hypothetical protein [Vibrio anguillarum]